MQVKTEQVKTDDQQQPVQELAEPVAEETPEEAQGE